MALEVEQVPLFLAPMSGVTGLAYRLLARECGADFTITEFTAAAALTRQDAKSWLKLESDERENPFIPQIFGGNIGHSPEERLGLAKRYSRLCRMLADQKIIVVSTR